MTPAARSARRLLRAIPGARRAALWLRDRLHPHARSVMRLTVAAPDGLFQPLAETSANRYPAIFAFVARSLAACPAQRILSYGCSTGEEAFSLAKLMPQAQITGIDINPHNITIAQRRAKTMAGNAPLFMCAAAPKDLSDASLDAIFCMAVTRHATLEADIPLDCSPWLRFDQFDTLMADFDRILVPGGLLAIWNSHFRFGDSHIADRYTTQFNRTINPARPPLYYGADNQRIDGEPPYTAAVFRKQTDA